MRPRSIRSVAMVPSGCPAARPVRSSSLTLASALTYWPAEASALARARRPELRSAGSDQSLEASAASSSWAACSYWPSRNAEKPSWRPADEASAPRPSRASQSKSTVKRRPRRFFMLLAVQALLNAKSRRGANEPAGSVIDAAAAAAVDGDRDAVQHVGTRRSEEGDQVGAFLRRDDALERIGGDALLAHLLVGAPLGLRLELHAVFPALGLHRARRGALDEDVVPRAEVGQALGEVDERRVGRAADEVVRDRLPR